MDSARTDGTCSRSRVCCRCAGGTEPSHTTRVAPGVLRHGGRGALDGHVRYWWGENAGRTSYTGRETGIRIEGRGRECDGGIWREGMGEEMGVRGGGVEELFLRVELLCVSLLVCSRGREKSKEVLGVAFLVVVFLGVDIVGMVERAGGDRLAGARGRGWAARRGGPARHRSGEGLEGGGASGEGRAGWDGDDGWRGDGRAGMAGREKDWEEDGQDLRSTNQIGQAHHVLSLALF